MVRTNQTVQSVKESEGTYDRWMYAGKILRDDMTIRYYHITEGASIFTSPGLDGGGKINRGKITEAFLVVFKKVQRASTVP